MESIVIIGAGQAGLQAAVSLRDEEFSGTITLTGDEDCQPYQRPPLSKAYLLGKIDASSLELRSQSFLSEQQIDYIMDDAARMIDPSAKSVVLNSGRTLPYHHLILATGAAPRMLTVQGAELDGCYYLRSKADASALKSKLENAKHILIIGAGFIGLEFASVASQFGRSVVIVEAAPTLLSRAVSRVIAEHILDAHISSGTQFRFSTSVSQFTSEQDGRVTGATLDNGETLTADLVLIGIGVEPNVTLAKQAGLSVDGGIVVNSALCTSDPSISAIGDCALAPSLYCDRPIRIESVQNAVDQARHVARCLTGKTLQYSALPWFWSDQGDVKLQIVGLISGYDQTVTRGDPSSGRFSVFCYRKGQLLGVETVNRPADHLAAKRFIGLPNAPTPEQAADMGFDLKSVFAYA